MFEGPSLLAADATQRAALLEVRGRLRSARRKHEAGLSASRWGVAPRRVLRHALTIATAATAVLVFLAAAGIIASYAVSGRDFRTQVHLSCCWSCTLHATRRGDIGHLIHSNRAMLSSRLVLETDQLRSE